MSLQTLARINLLIGLAVGLPLLAFLFSSRMRASRLWRVTVTPLASIIGSGFLIVAPVMYREFRMWALPLVVLLNGLAYAIGAALRDNIRHEGPALTPTSSHYDPLVVRLEGLSDLALGLSYIVSVTFYATLLSAFALSLAGISPMDRVGSVSATVLIRGGTTAILLFVGLWGLLRGLHALEDLEKVAVNIKLAIIGMLLAALAAFFVFSLRGLTPVHYAWETTRLSWHAWAVLGGLLLITQGFETVKYLDEYPVELRTRAMRYAQGLAALIYILFVPLAGPISQHVRNVSETAIIDVLQIVAWGMGYILSAAAIFSQFGAVIADTIGSGGLLARVSRHRLRQEQAYMLIAALGMALTWLFSVFEIIALASRAFAVYYLLQTLIAIRLHLRRGAYGRVAGYGLVALLLVGIVLFAVPAH